MPRRPPKARAGNMFYEGQLQNGVSEAERRSDWLLPKAPDADPDEPPAQAFPWPTSFV